MGKRTKVTIWICVGLTYLFGVGVTTAWGEAHWTTPSGKPDIGNAVSAGFTWPFSVPVIFAYEVSKTIWSNDNAKY